MESGPTAEPNLDIAPRKTNSLTSPNEGDFTSGEPERNLQEFSTESRGPSIASN
jgi:hypothetical protein